MKTQIRQLTEHDIIRQIKTEIERIKSNENFSDSEKGKSFVLWILLNYFDLDKESALIKMTDSPNDKRIDAFIEEDEVIKIIQCKFSDSPSREVSGNDVVLFKGCIDWLKNPNEVKRLNLDRLYDASLTFSERWNDNIDVQLHFFAFCKFSTEADHERIVFNNSDLRDRVQMYFHDINDIITFYRSKLQIENPLENEQINIELIPGEYFIKKSGMQSIVASIKGKDILKMFHKYGNSLFERNIRLYKGARKESINAKIISTILDENERKNFWYYNNGISFVCSDFSVNDNVNPPILSVKGFQVINGCQTTVCLSKAKETMQQNDIPQDVQLVVRFIKAPIKEIDLITLYTNSQNPVSEIQLKANDPIQKRLKEELSRLSPPYFYSIKEGDWQILSRSEKNRFKNRIIEMAEVAQAIYSFTSDPAFARRWKNKLFSEKYYDIFKKDLSIYELLLPWKILKIINNQIASYRIKKFNNLRRNPSQFTVEQKQDIKRKEFLIYSNLIMLYFIGKLISKRYNQYTPTIAKKLLNNRLDGRIKKIFNYLVSVLKYSDKILQETNLPRFLKNIENINMLYNEIQKQFDADTARLGKDPLKEMLPQIN